MKYIIASFMILVIIGIAIAQTADKVVIDNDTFYTKPVLYAGMQEIKIHYLDANGIKQDIYRSFAKDAVVTKADVQAVVIELQKPVEKPVVIESVPPITPYEAYLKMKDKKVTEETTWQEVIEGKLTDKEVVK